MSIGGSITETAAPASTQWWGRARVSGLFSGGVLAELGRLGSEVTGVLVGGIGPKGRGSRSVWSGGGRLHIEVKGLGDPSLPLPRRAALAKDVEEALASHGEVVWAVANEALGHAVVSHRGGALAEDLVGLVERAEAAHGLEDAAFSPLRPDHPGDDAELRRQAFLALSDAAMIALAAASAAAGSPRLAQEVVSLVSFADNQPMLREMLARLLGERQAEVAMGSANAVAQGLGQGIPGLVADLLYRASACWDAAARLRAFERLEPSLCGQEWHSSYRLGELAQRPEPVPDGPLERHARRSSAAGLGGGLTTAALATDLRRGVGMLHAGVPKASRLGREVFATQLGRLLAGRGALVIEPGALRVLDRVDTVVVEAAALSACARLEVERLVVAVRHGGHMLALADAEGGADWDADLILGPEMTLAEQIRSLQADGCIVMGFCSDPEALAACDVGVGLVGQGRRPSWAADVLVPEDQLWWIVEAAVTAAHLSRQSVAIASVGAAMGSVAALAALTGSQGGSRAALAVNSMSLVAIANAARAAAALAARQPPQPVQEPPPFHSMEPEEVLSALGSSPAGLSQSEAAARRQVRPSPPGPATRLVASITDELVNPLTPVLAAGGGLSAALGSTLDAAIVGIVVAANAVLGGVQRFLAGNEVDRLEREVEIPVAVRRDGRLCFVSPEEVVVGDVVELRGGDPVVADCRILACEGLAVDQSSITGESELVAKSPRPCLGASLADRSSMLYAGTSVALGSAQAVVVAVGEQTQAASSAALGQVGARSGVEERLSGLTAAALPVSIGGGAAAGVAALAHRVPLASALGTGVTLAVAAVPEGLPVVATMAQLAAARRLASLGALVRDPRAVEAIGRVDVLCTDKTGTLTAGRTTVRTVSDGVEEALPAALGRRHRDVVAVALRASPPPWDGQALAHPIDAAIARLADAEGIGRERSVGAWAPLGELAFESSRGYHASVGETPRGLRCSVKGAPEVVLPRCVRWRGAPGRRGALGEEERSLLMAKVDHLARRGYRVLAVAEGPGQAGELRDEQVGGLALVGLLGLGDPLREEAASALAGLGEAGISVVMVTGDHPSTAEGIAAEAGILDGRAVMSGAELAVLSDDRLDEVVSEVAVFARVSPADKVRVVRSLQRTGRTVAVTGDGANDAAAIHLADVGVAMGEHCAPAARQAADVVIADGDLTTLISAVLEGRALWRSVRAALALLLGGNLGEVAFTVASSAVAGVAALSPRQLLVVNLMTDVAPALAVATRPPGPYVSSELVGEGPERSLGAQLERAILLRAGITSTATAAAWGLGWLGGDRESASTTALVTLVGAQLGQTLVSGITHPPVVASCIGSAAVLAAMVQTPGLSHLVGCVPLRPTQWAVAAAASAAAVAASVSAPVAARLAPGVLRLVLPAPAGTASAG